MSDNYKVRCPDCKWARHITNDDVSDSRHTPKSKAHRRARMGANCPFCGHASLAVSPL